MRVDTGLQCHVDTNRRGTTHSVIIDGGLDHTMSDVLESDDPPVEALVDRCVDAEVGDDETRDALKRHLLDTFGLILGAREAAESSLAFREAVRTLVPGSGEGTGEAVSLATGESLSADAAAMLDGAFAHSLDFDDTHRESSLHPGAPVIPAALAVAQREGTSTNRLLAGVRAGYDVTCAVGRAVGPDAHYDRGFHITATCGTFGATAAAGVVAGLAPDELRDAFGANASQAAGSLQFLANGAWNKRLHPGLAARRGVTAVALAQAGFRGAAEPLGGQFGFFRAYSDDPDPDAIVTVEREAVAETALKPYPCCRYMHSAIDALTSLANEVDPAAVESVTVDLPAPGVRLTGDPIDAKRRPENFVDCQFSMPFAAALSLWTGDAGLRAFLDVQSELSDPSLRRLMDATEVVTTDAVSSFFPEQWAARVVVETEAGTYERLVKTASGEPEDPLGWAGVAEKYDELVGVAGVPTDAADELERTVHELETRSVADLAAAFESLAE